jgi:hypothetical protein
MTSVKNRPKRFAGWRSRTLDSKDPPSAAARQLATALRRGGLRASWELDATQLPLECNGVHLTGRTPSHSASELSQRCGRAVLIRQMSTNPRDGNPLKKKSPHAKLDVY